MIENKILVVGDTHGEWGRLNELIHKKLPQLILQVGDFGYWPHFHNSESYAGSRVTRWDQYGIKNPYTEILFCDGNHEDHWSLNALSDHTIMDRVYHMPRGSTYQLKDGRTVLFMGGANSIDKNLRKIGVDWFPEEIITQKDVMDLPDVKVDIVISHTCPDSFSISGLYDDRDPSRKALQYVLEKYRPSLWYFGHFHTHKTEYTNSCRWFCLNELGKTGGWEWLA